jgi:glycosidase
MFQIRCGIRTAIVAVFFALCSLSFGQLSFLGNTNTLLSGYVVPKRGAFLQPSQTLTVTTQTYPIAAGQSVSAIVTKDNWVTSTEIPFNFDINVGNNSRWYGLIGPYPAGSNVQFYLRARGNGAPDQYDSLGGQNYGFTWRFSPAVRRGAILQWFATDYRVIMARLPEVVQAGYSAIYVPPPSKSGGGTFSVGYNPVDHFDLGDRLLSGTVRTRYGTTEDLVELIRTAKRFGLEVYCDLVTNHADNRASWPINRYPALLPEDFHIHSTADPTNSEVDFNSGPLSSSILNGDLVGLADIAQENGNQVQNGAFNLPSFASMNIWGKPWYTRHPLTPQYYPGGTIGPEDVREYLKRYCWYLIAGIGFDGLRIDAAKHTTPAFFMNAIGQGGYSVNNGDLLPYVYSLNPRAMVFGEVLSSDNYELREFAKVGMDLLDFPLSFKFNNLFNSNGFGSIGSLGNTFGIDSSTGLGFQYGGIDSQTGVGFVQSHDNGPPTSTNLAHAFLLTRPGSSIVYYDGNNQKPGDYSQFPRPGRFDSLGNADDITLKMTDARFRFARGILVNRWQSDNLYIYDREVNGQSLMLVGLNIRGDLTSLTQTVGTAFAPGTILEDLSGQEPNITVGGDQSVTVTVPPNSSPTVSNNASGYVFYVPVTAKATGPSTITVIDADSSNTYATSAVNTPIGTYGTGSGTNYQSATVTGNHINIAVNTTTVGDSAFLQLDNGNLGPWYPGLRNTDEGLMDGTLAMERNAPGSFQFQGLDLSNLADGLHMLRIRVFNTITASPKVFSDFYYWFNLKRGLGTNWMIDGDLSEFGPNANWWQERAPSSQSNRLDGLFLSNDDQYIYVGVAGRTDATENLTNGISVLIDTEVGLSGGVTTLNQIKDDSGPATRLLSNTALSMPSGFRAKYAIASFRNSGLSSSPEASFSGSPIAPLTTGAQAGTWWINTNSLTRLSGIPSVISCQPRPSPSGPVLGMEAAIPIRNLYPNGTSGYSPMGFISYLGTTGEAGTTLSAYDPLRATLGGYPAAHSWISNQFLPTQTNVSGDPGTSALSLTRYLTYFPMRAQYSGFLLPKGGPVVPIGGTRSSQLVTMTNTGSSPVNGPILMTINLGPRDFTTIVNKRADTIFGGHRPYVLIQSGPLAAGGTATFTVIYDGSRSGLVMPSFTVYVGKGAL